MNSMRMRKREEHTITTIINENVAEVEVNKGMYTISCEMYKKKKNACATSELSTFFFSTFFPSSFYFFVFMLPDKSKICVTRFSVCVYI